MTSNHSLRTQQRMGAGPHFLHLVERIAEHSLRFRADALEQIGQFNLGPTHSDALYALTQRNHLTMKELAAKIHRDKSTVTALVRKLEKRGLVERIRDENDRRITLLALTVRGQRLRRPLLAEYERLHRQAGAGLAQKERKQLAELLTRALANWTDTV